MQRTASTTLDSVLLEVKTLVEQLLAAKCCEVDDLPTSRGVYLIYDKAGNIIYVGQGKDVHRRICVDHRGGDEDISTSTFRRAIHKLHGIAAGQPLRVWVINNCSFAHVSVSDSDLCTAVEAVTIRVLRKQGCKLLNA